MTPAIMSLYTAEEFLEQLREEGPTELVDGMVKPMPLAGPRHGQICARIARLQGNFCEDTYGHVLTNDVSIVTKRDPDRGADVAYFSYGKVPKGPLPPGFLPVPPDLIVEVRCPSDRNREVMDKVSEYLEAGVSVVCVVDPASETASVHRSECDEEQHSSDDLLKFDDVFPGFSVPLKKLFE